MADLSAGTYSHKGAGASKTTALVFGGLNPSETTTTEEWTAPSTFRKLNLGDIYYNADPSSGVLKYVGYGTGAWASGGNLNQQGYALYSGGTQTAGIKVGGWGGPPVGALNDAETYNGTAWTQANDINTSRSNEGGAGSGTSTAALIYAGYGHPAARLDTVESFDGTNWTETTEVNTARNNTNGVGTQTASLVFAGSTAPGSPNYSDAVESWVGTSWPEVAEISSAKAGGAGV